MSDNSYVEYSITEGVMHIRLTRNDKKNALTGDMYRDLADALMMAHLKDEVRVALIEGGEDFSAGNDLDDFMNSPDTGDDAPVGKFMNTLYNCSVPVVAAVDGVAVGIGTTLLMHCDLVYCTDRAKFMLPFVNLGLVPEFCSTMVLPRLMGHVKAAELLMLGEPFGADVAHEVGLVNRVVASDELIAVAVEVANKLAAKPAMALKQTKALMQASRGDMDDHMKQEMEIFALLVRSEECRSRMAAILNKS